MVSVIHTLDLLWRRRAGYTGMHNSIVCDCMYTLALSVCTCRNILTAGFDCVQSWHKIFLGVYIANIKSLLCSYFCLCCCIGSASSHWTCAMLVCSKLIHTLLTLFFLLPDYSQFQSYCTRTQAHYKNRIICNYDDVRQYNCDYHNVILICVYTLAYSSSPHFTLAYNHYTDITSQAGMSRPLLIKVGNLRKWNCRWTLGRFLVLDLIAIL